MRSTMTASAVKKHKLSVPNMIAPSAPPFPKLESESEDEIDKDDVAGMELQYSGDVANPLRENMSGPCKLSPIPEEEVFAEAECGKDVMILHKIERRDSSVNTDAVMMVSPSHLILHQYPKTATGPHVTSALSLETSLRRSNISFTVKYDCNGFAGPWIIDEGRRIEGVVNCMKYVQRKFPNASELHYAKVDDFPSEITTGPYYPMTGVDVKNPINDLHCSMCRGQANLCSVCEEYRNVVMNQAGTKELKRIPEDLYIDDDFESLMELVGKQK